MTGSTTNPPPGDGATRPALGVLFVHGIGQQQQGSTLAQGGSALVSWVDRWLRRQTGDAGRGGPGAQVASVDLAPRNAETPAHCIVEVRPSEGPSQRWLLAEAWWAASVSPPRFGQLARWALPMVPWLASEYAYASGANHPPAGPSRPSQGEASGSGVDEGKSWIERSPRLGWIAWLLSPILAMALIALIFVVGLLTRVPIVGGWAKKLVARYEQGIGDAYLFAHDPLPRGAMLRRIAEDLRWVQERSDKVVVVAHSQGAALSHDVLSSPGLRRGPDAEPSRARDGSAPRPVDLFITLGSAVRRLHNIRKLQYDSRLRALGWRSISALVLLAAGAASFAVASRAPAALWLGAALTAVGVRMYAQAQRGMNDNHRGVFPELALQTDTALEWIDYYATADPVPNGPLDTRQTGGQLEGNASEPVGERPCGITQVDSRTVHNLRSIMHDHSAYFDASDDFVTRLVANLARVAGLPTAMPKSGWTAVTAGMARRRWRTSCWSNARNLLLIAVAYGAAMLTLPRSGGSGWFRLGHWLGAAERSRGLGGLLVAIRDWLREQELLGLKQLGGWLVGLVGPETFSALIVAALAVIVGSAVLAWSWASWSEVEIERLFSVSEAEAGAGVTDPRRVEDAERLRRVARRAVRRFLALTVLLTAGIALVVAQFVGAPAVQLAALVAALSFSGVLVVQRWLTCFRRSTRQLPEVADLRPATTAIGATTMREGSVSMPVGEPAASAAHPAEAAAS